jgi:hypothetical protein
MGETLKITIPDELLAECRKAAEAISPGKKFRLGFAMSLDGTITAHAAYRKGVVTLGAFGAKKIGGGSTAGVTGTIEFEPAP